MKLVLFDCDGVLVDSEHMGCTLEAEMLQDMGVPIAREEGIKLFWGKDYAFTKQYVLETYGIKVPESFFEAFHIKEKELFKTHLKPIADVSAVLEKIPNKAVVSNGQFKKIKNSLSVTGLKPHFDDEQIFHIDLVTCGKPAPDIYELAAEKMGCAPAECIVVEDSISGVQAAVAAGMCVYGFTGGTHIIDKPSHARMLKALGAREVFGTMAEIKAALPATVFKFYRNEYILN